MNASSGDMNVRQGKLCESFTHSFGGMQEPPYLQLVVSESEPSWPKLVPASLLPYGGFGDPSVPSPVWRIPEGFDVDKVEQAQFQHRLACAARICMASQGITEQQLEEQLGYRHRGWLIRKLNGTEAMTLRDVARLEKIFGRRLFEHMP
jgi:hypothetical protein